MGDKEIQHEGLQLDIRKNYLKAGLCQSREGGISSVQEKCLRLRCILPVWHWAEIGDGLCL